MKKVLAIVVSIIVVFVAGFIVGTLKDQKDHRLDPGNYTIQKENDDGTKTNYYLHVNEDGSTLVSHIESILTDVQ